MLVSGIEQHPKCYTLSEKTSFFCMGGRLVVYLVILWIRNIRSLVNTLILYLFSMKLSIPIIAATVSFLHAQAVEVKINPATDTHERSEEELKGVTYSFTKLEGIGLEKGITRRDPSDVILVSGVYYVYYTKVVGQASGYWGDMWYATSKDGFKWQESGPVLGLGNKDKFDSQAVFSPNIIKVKKQYYLFYTGVKPTLGRTDGVFENNSTTDITALGLAVSNNPNGPFKRISEDPILEVSNNAEDFDSFRIDDAAVLFKNGEYLLYYKGRSRYHGKVGPRYTQMGVALCAKPEGPFIKHGKPLLAQSHEVLIWKQGKGVAALASISSTLEYSETGLDFATDKKNIAVENRPFAPGAFRPDLTGGKSDRLNWGVSMVHNGPSCYLIRYDVKEK